MSNDDLIQFYLNEGLEFDAGIWSEKDGSYELQCFNNNVRVTKTLYFSSLLSLNQFCMKCNCKIIMESD